MSTIDKHYFFEILSKYRQGKASEEEIRFLHAYYNSFEVFPDFLTTENEHLLLKLEKDTKDVIDDQLNQYQNEVRRRRFHRLIIKYSAAAILIISACAYLIFIKNQAVKDAQEEFSKAQSIVAGGNNAILTLADGSKVVLNELKNGVITKENNALIIKKEDGNITYTVNAKRLSAEITKNVLTTPKGGTFQIQLPDGSKVWLNAASSLSYPTAFIGKERVVELNGEAYFEVAHNESQPFKVKTSNQEVEVLGTHFNVNSYADEAVVKTTLLEGSVRVRLTEGVKQIEEVVLKPGQQSLNDRFLVVQQADLRQVMGWKNGDFIFKRAPLDKVMRELSRWYDVEVEYVSDIKINRTYSGFISRTKNLSAVLKMLKSTGQIKFEIEGKKIKVIEI